MDDFISIVLPTYNRGEILLEVLPCYLRQKYVREIIIVDDFCTDNTEDLVKGYICNSNKIRYIKNDRMFSSLETVNIGIENSTGSHIFIGEDDIEPSDSHLETLYRHMQKEDADIISGRRIWGRMNESRQDALVRANRSKGILIDYKTLLTNFQLNSEDDESTYLLDACILMKREVFDNVRFDSKLFRDPVAWRGETDFQLSAVEKGYKLVFCPHTYCYHRPRRYKNILQSIKYDFNAFKNNYLLLRKHRDLINSNFEVKSIALIFLFCLFRIFKENFLIFAGTLKRSMIRFFSGNKHK